MSGTGTSTEQTYYNYDQVGNRKWQCIDTTGDFVYDSVNPTGYEIKTEYTYDNMNRLTDLYQHYVVSGNPVQKASYEYKLYADGMRSSVTETVPIDAAPWSEQRKVAYQYDNLNRLLEEFASDNLDDTPESSPPAGNGYHSKYLYDLAGNRSELALAGYGRQVKVFNGASGQVLTTEQQYYPGTDRLMKETNTQAVAALPWKDNTRIYAYAGGSGGGFTYKLPGENKHIGQVMAFALGLPSVWSKWLLWAVLAMIPIVAFAPVLFPLYRRLSKSAAGDTGKISSGQAGAKTQVPIRLKLWQRCLCVLLSYVMLLSPVVLESLHAGAINYDNLDVASWGTGGTTISYFYDANGSLTSKLTSVTGGDDTEKVDYTYNLQNRLSRVVTDSTPTVLTDDVDVVDYTYNTTGIRVATHSFSVDPAYLGDPEEQTYATGHKTVDYLIDPQNHTGYAQVLEEWAVNDTTATLITYTIGDDIISQTKSYWTWSVSEWILQNTDPTQYLLYDGHGSTRQLAKYDDTTDTVTAVDSYNYDSYGVMLQDSSAQANPGYTPPQATSLLYAGEHFDTDSQHYYNRARWLNPYNGRFNRTDPFAGNMQDPQSLHKYLYCHANPINGVDPTGRLFSSPYHGGIVHRKISFHFRNTSANDRLSDRRINTILGTNIPWWCWGWDRPDLVDRTTGEVWEIKPLGMYTLGATQLSWYLLLLNSYDPLERDWKPGFSYFPPPVVQIDPMSYAIVFFPKLGVIEYEVIEFRVITSLIALYYIYRLTADVKMKMLQGALVPI